MASVMLFPSHHQSAGHFQAQMSSNNQHPTHPYSNQYPSQRPFPAPAWGQPKPPQDFMYSAPIPAALPSQRYVPQMPMPSVDVQSVIQGLSRAAKDAILKYQPHVQVQQDDERVLLALQHQLKAQQHLAPVSPVNIVHKKKAHTKEVLPCFNMICTGTCAYGMKCTFLHDPRAQLPKHCRKHAEFLLQSHLHTFRPYGHSNKDGSKNKKQSKDDDEALFSGTDSECGSVTSGSCASNSNDAIKTASAPFYSKSQGFKRDDIFDFPVIELPHQDSNSKCYDPSETSEGPMPNLGTSEYWRELSMWYHLLAAVNAEKVGLERIPMIPHAHVNKNASRLPVFQLLSYGKQIEQGSF